MTDSDRIALLETYGRWYGAERLAIAFTSSTTGDDAKRVVTSGWDRTPPLSSGDFGAAFVKGRGATRNPVVVLRPSNLVVVECDTEGDLAAIQALKLPPTITVVSSAPYRRHFYYRPPAEIEHLPVVAFRFESSRLSADSGRYFLCPPAIHPSGATYRFLPNHGPGEMDIAEFPEYAYHDLSKRAREETAAQTEAIAVDPGAKVQAGQRGDRIFRYASMLRRWGLSRDAILDACLIWNDDRCDPPIELRRVEMQVDGAMKMRGGQEIEYAVEHPKGDPDDQPIWEDDEDDPDDNWRMINMTDPAFSVPPDPPAVCGLLYRSQRHVISGVTESSKTLLAYWLILQALRQGSKVAVIDFEMGPFRARRMLEDLGATLEEIGEIGFITPSSAPENGLMRLVVRGYEYVLIDAAVGAYDVSGLDDNARKEVEEFGRRWVDPLWKAGISTILIDHVTKNVETRGKFTIGSERKVGQTDVHLSMESRKALTRGGSGLVNVVAHKDRSGFLARPTAAVFHLSSDPLTHAITVERNDPPVVQTDAEGNRRWTKKMVQISRFLEHPTIEAGQEGGFSTSEIQEGCPGDNNKLRPALATLVKEGYLRHTEGLRGANLYTLAKPYAEATDPLLQDNPSDPSASPLDPSGQMGLSDPSGPSAPFPRRGRGRGVTTGRQGGQEETTPLDQFTLVEDDEMDEQDRAMLDKLRSEEAHRRVIDQDG